MKDKTNGHRSGKYAKASSGKISWLLAAIALILTAVVILLICGIPDDEGETQTESTTAPTTVQTTDPTEETVTEETVEQPTAPADGDPENVTCQGSYTVTDSEVREAAETVVATVGEEKLTNGMLQVYYWLEVAQYLRENPEVTFEQPLDTVLCDLDSTAVTWQQYFLQRALNTWHSHQALVLMGDTEGMPTEEAYQPVAECHEKYLNAEMPALEHLYGYTNADYEPNARHQAWLDSLEDVLEDLAAEGGYSDLAALTADLAGGGTAVEDLVRCAELYNRAYMYFTELTYYTELTEEEIQAYATEHGAEYESAGITDSEYYVDFRHILLVPENAEISADGIVTASEEDWTDCLREAQGLYYRCQYNSFAEHTFAELANKNSTDEGSRLNGGLYTHISKGQLIPELDEWLFDSSRKHGDREIIRTSCGYHLVYFSGSVNALYAQAEKDLAAEVRLEAVRGAMEKYPVTVDYGAICLGEAEQNGTGLDPDTVLYPDVAHERFPTAPLYFQQDYPKTWYGQYPIDRWGCGITTMAMLSSYMTDEEWTPPELCRIYGYYCAEQGTNIVMYDDVPGEMGFFLEKRSWDWNEIIQALEDGKVVICLQYKGYWTNGGHFLLLEEITEDGLIVVRDSNIYNYGKLSGHQIDAHEASVITPRGAYYWIYQPKITRIPACVRCDDTDRTGVTTALFTEDYLCDRCETAMGRRGDFVAACEAVK